MIVTADRLESDVMYALAVACKDGLSGTFELLVQLGWLVVA